MRNYEETEKMILEIYDTKTNEEEKFFRCPECWEPIYKCDYSDFSECPVCGFEWYDFMKD